MLDILKKHIDQAKVLLDLFLSELATGNEEGLDWKMVPCYWYLFEIDCKGHGQETLIHIDIDNMFICLQRYYDTEGIPKEEENWLRRCGQYHKRTILEYNKAIKDLPA